MTEQDLVMNMVLRLSARVRGASLSMDLQTNMAARKEIANCFRYLPGDSIAPETRKLLNQMYRVNKRALERISTRTTR